MLPRTSLEAILTRERAIVTAGLGGITVLAWAYVLSSAASADATPTAMAMPQMHAWSTVDFALVLAMWAVMMVAMMLPSAAPMILLFTTVNRNQGAQQAALVPTGVFVLGYVLVWGGFAALATTAQWALHTGALLTAMMGGSTSPLLGGALLLTAGIYQWPPLKRACLTQCRTPLGFLMAEWRPGSRGALAMGLRHGLYCLGCCWMLMALLFVGGIMNVLWVAGIAAFVLVEKLAPAGRRLGQVAGIVLLAWGAWLIIARFAPPGTDSFRPARDGCDVACSPRPIRLTPTHGEAIARASGGRGQPRPSRGDPLLASPVPARPQQPCPGG